MPSPEWKAKHSKEPWYPGETVIAGIGQGYWKVTLLQLARGVAALADNGWRNRLHLGADWLLAALAGRETGQLRLDPTAPPHGSSR